MRSCVLALSVLGWIGGSPAHAQPSVTRPAPGAARPDPRYNEVHQHSTHNAYGGGKPALRDQLEKFQIHSLELDLHTSKGPRTTAPRGSWFVYHLYLVDDSSSCNTLSDCLAQIHAWHEAFPRHEVVTVFLDLKDGWSPRHGAAELDAALHGMFSSALVGPSRIAGACTGSLREALARCRWPELSGLRGKLLFVLTGPNDLLVEYQRAGGGAAFIAPRITSSSGIDAHPGAVFFNLDSDHFAVGAEVMSRGFVSRVFYRNTPLKVHGINDPKNWRIAVQNHIHHIATDAIDASWSRTRNAGGWPFACMRHDCSGLSPQRMPSTPPTPCSPEAGLGAR